MACIVDCKLMIRLATLYWLHSCSSLLSYRGCIESGTNNRFATQRFCPLAETIVLPEIRHAWKEAGLFQDSILTPFKQGVTIVRAV